MLLKAAEAIAHVVKDEELNPNFIIPSVFNPDVPKAVAAAIRGADDMTTLGDFHATTLDGQDRDLGDYVGDVVLVVNTASKCGLTPQYEGLQQLYDDYADQGLTILGFPCDQFGHQEPGTEEEIGAFCQQNYGVTFPMFAKIDVNGDDTHPLYQWLKHKKSGALGGQHQVELHQVPDRSRRAGHQALRPDQGAGRSCARRSRRPWPTVRRRG